MESLYLWAGKIIIWGILIWISCGPIALLIVLIFSYIPWSKSYLSGALKDIDLKEYVIIFSCGGITLVSVLHDMIVSIKDINELNSNKRKEIIRTESWWKVKEFGGWK